MTVDPCEQWEERLSALLDGELSEAERRELTEHLAGCGACRAYLADLTAIHEAMEAVPAPEGFARSVMDRVAHTKQDAGRKVIPWRRWGLLAACCALAALGLWQFRAGGGASGGGAPPPAAARSAVAEDWEEAKDQPEGDAAEGALPALQSAAPEEESGETAPASLFEDGAAAGPPAQKDQGEELLDREAASELFGHPLAACAAEDFLGYSLEQDGGGDGGTAYTGAGYRFTSGTVSVRDQDRAGYVPPAEDAVSVSYNGETFYVRDADHGDGCPVVLHFPNGETGLAYAARFDAGVELTAVFELLLSLEIP